MERNYDIFRIKVLRFGLPKSVPTNVKIGALPFQIESDSSKSLNFLDKSFCDNNLLQLSSEFGKVYVGETLRLVVSISNISSDKVESADISADLYIERNPNNSGQQPNQKDLKNLKSFYLENVKSMDPFTFNLEFKVDQPYTYFIMFNIQYKQEIRVLNNQMNNQIVDRLQTKRFRFDARMPFIISNRIFKQLERGKMFVEMKLENSTKSQVYLKTVDMIPAEGLEVTPLEKIREEVDVVLNVSESKKLIFCMKAANSKAESMLLANNSASSTATSINIGQLYLRWFNVTGGPGDLHSKYIPMTVMSSDLDLEIKAPLEYLLKDKIYAFEMTLTNKTAFPLDLILAIYEKEMLGLKIIGLSHYDIKLSPKESFEFVMFVLPLMEGIQKFLGLRIFNRLTEVEIACMPLKDIIVKGSEAKPALHMAQSQHAFDMTESLI